MHKSNHPEAARKLRSNFDRIYSKGGRPSGLTEVQQFESIMANARYLAKYQTRGEAIQYLQSQRPWLQEYVRGLTSLPSSGAILDDLLKQ